MKFLCRWVYIESVVLGGIERDVFYFVLSINCMGFRGWFRWLFVEIWF